MSSHQSQNFKCLVTKLRFLQRKVSSSPRSPNLFSLSQLDRDYRALVLQVYDFQTFKYFLCYCFWFLNRFYQILVTIAWTTYTTWFEHQVVHQVQLPLMNSLMIRVFEVSSQLTSNGIYEWKYYANSIIFISMKHSFLTDGVKRNKAVLALERRIIKFRIRNLEVVLVYCEKMFCCVQKSELVSAPIIRNFWTFRSNSWFLCWWIKWNSTIFLYLYSCEAQREKLRRYKY